MSDQTDDGDVDNEESEGNVDNHAPQKLTNAASDGPTPAPPTTCSLVSFCNSPLISLSRMNLILALPHRGSSNIIQII